MKSSLLCFAFCALPVAAAPYDVNLFPSARLIPLEDGLTPADLDAAAISSTGNLLFASAVGTAGVFDITNPLTPFQIGEFSAGFGFIYDIAVLNENHVCLVGDFGLAVFNVSNPASPVQVGPNFSLAPGASRIGFRIRMIGSTAWITGMFGLKVVQLADPEAPVITASLNTGISYGVAFHGNYAYIAARTSGLRIVDISNPTTPSLIRTIPSAGSQTRDAIVHNGALYSAESDEGIRVFDLTDPVIPLAVKTLRPNASGGSGPERLLLWEQRLAAPLYEGGTVFYDVSSPLNPVFDSRMNAAPDTTEPFAEFNGRPGATSGGVWSTAATGNTVIQLEGTRGMSLTTEPSPARLQRLNSIATGGNPQGLAIKGNIVYMAAGEAGIKILNASNPTAPTLISTVDTPGFANSLSISENLLAVGDGEAGVQLFDISTPAAPALSGVFDTPGDAGQTAFASASSLLVADRSIYERDPFSLQLTNVISGALHIVDVSNPATPVVIGRYVPPPLAAATPNLPEIRGSILSVSVSGQTALVSNGPKGNYVLDLSNPSAPTKIAEIGIEQPGSPPGSMNYWSASNSLFLSSGHAVVGHGWGGWQIVNLNTPSSPEVISSIPAAGRDTSFLHTGNKLFVSLGLNGIEVYDISNMSLPVLEGASTIVASQGLVASGDIILSSGTAHYADATESLVTLRYFDPQTTPRFVNPARLPDGSYQCGVLALPGTRWSVIHSNTGGSWQGLPDIVTGGRNPVYFTDEEASSHPRRLYLLTPVSN